MILDLPHFVRARQGDWSELEALLERLESDPSTVWSLEEAQRFHLLYQKTGADLVKLQTLAFEATLCSYLEALVARAYAQIYEGQRQTKNRLFNPWRWFTVSFPRAFQSHARALWLVIALTLLGCLFGGGVVAFDPGSKSLLVPFSHLHGKPSERVAKEEEAKREEGGGSEMRFSAHLMQNNIRVSILAFTLGMTCGIGTGIILFYNGAILGVVVTDYLLDGQGLFLTAWLLPHGSIEIPALLIAGQAGFVLGGALLGRGQRAPLGLRLKERAPAIVSLLGGVVVMLIWAGLIEAWISQLHQPVLPYSLKVLFGVSQLAGLGFLLLRRLPPAKGEEGAA